MKKIFAAAVLLAAMTACGGAQNDKPLEGPVWKLVSMEGVPASAIESGEDAFTLLFSADDMSVGGRTDCNLFFGNYEAIDGTMAFGEMGMTRMACPDMEYEEAFMRMLESVDGFTIEGEHLSLLSGEQVLATFKAVETEVAE